MVTCKGCGLDTVDPTQPARYDVLKPGANLDDISSLGPYDEACFAETYTGKKLLEGESTE